MSMEVEDNLTNGLKDKLKETDNLTMHTSTNYGSSPSKLSNSLSLGSATMYKDGDIEYDIQDEQPKSKEPKKCLALRTCCHRTFKPIQTQFNPLPENPSCGEKAKYFFMCPPHGKIGGFILLVLMFGVWLAVLISMTGKESLPGGNLFALIVLLVTCWLGGYLISLVKHVIHFLPLPPLLGMLIVGGLLRNIPQIAIAKDIHPEWSSGARNMALGIILLRAGLGLDPSALRKLSFVVIRLAFSPCLMETVADAVASHFLLGFPWEWAFMLGFVIAAVSPAVVVPCLLGLQEQGYGVDKGIPTLVIAAASIDDVLAITGFGVVLGIAFSQGNLAWTLLKGPIEALVGVALGTVMGVILWYFPQKSSRNLVLFRSVMLVGFGLMSIFLSTYLKWAGSGPLGCLTLAFVAALRWRKEYTGNEKNPIEDVVGVLWMIFQPLLFGLIGAEVEIVSIHADTVGLGLATLGIGLAVRMVVSFLAVFLTDLNFKERFFIPLAWLPKATVQAAIGAKAYDMAKSEGNSELEEFGKKVLTLAVLSIIVTAPFGAALISILGPRLLKETPRTEELEIEEAESAKSQEEQPELAEERTPLKQRHQDQILTIAVLSILITAPIGAALVTIFGPQLLKKTKPISDVAMEVDVPDEELGGLEGQSNPVFVGEEEEEGQRRKGSNPDLHQEEDKDNSSHHEDGSCTYTGVRNTNNMDTTTRL